MGVKLDIHIGLTTSSDFFIDWAVVRDVFCQRELEDITNEDLAPQVYWYDVDGNTQLTHDPYGKPIRAFPVEFVLSRIETQPDENDIRGLWAVELLQRARQLNKEHPQLKLMTALYWH